MLARRHLALLGFMLGMTSGLARADVPPPDDYVEECTASQAEVRTDGHCQLCSLSNYAESDACAKQ